MEKKNYAGMRGKIVFSGGKAQTNEGIIRMVENNPEKGLYMANSGLRKKILS